MGCVWVWDWDTEVEEPRATSLLNQTLSVTLSNYHRRPFSASSPCDIVVVVVVVIIIEENNYDQLTKEYKMKFQSSNSLNHIPFQNKRLPLVMRQNSSPLSLVYFPPPQTVWSDSSHKGISEWTCQCCGEVTGSRG